MRTSFCKVTVAAVLTSASIAFAQPVPIYGLVELSGPGATAGTNFDNGESWP